MYSNYATCFQHEEMKRLGSELKMVGVVQLTNPSSTHTTQSASQHSGPASLASQIPYDPFLQDNTWIGLLSWNATWSMRLAFSFYHNSRPCAGKQSNINLKSSIPFASSFDDLSTKTLIPTMSTLLFSILDQNLFQKWTESKNRGIYIILFRCC